MTPPIRRSDSINAGVYDQMAAANHPLCRPASDHELADPMATIDPAGWLGGSILGRRVLCLAAGGGRHADLYLAAGARVTIVDLSAAMLDIDRRHRGPLADGSLRLIHGSMDHLPMLTDAEFDLVVHPVSTCYVRDVMPVFAEVARVLRPGGLYVSQHKSAINLQSSLATDDHDGYRIVAPYATAAGATRPPPGPLAERTSATARRLREPGAIEFVHTMQTLLGGICRSGFVIEDFIEPDHRQPDAAVGTFAHRANYVAPYLRIKARRVGGPEGDRDSPSTLILA